MGNGSSTIPGHSSIRLNPRSSAINPNGRGNNWDFPEKRDAQVGLEPAPRLERVRYLSPEGRAVKSERLIRTTAEFALLRKKENGADASRQLDGKAWPVYAAWGMNWVGTNYTNCCNSQLAALACAHQKKPAAAGAVEVHGRIIADGEPAGGATKKSALAAWWAFTPMAGKCEFSACMKDGWTTDTAQGAAATRCEFGDCAGEGWSTRHADGTASKTRCTFRSCWKDGWTTTNDDGTSVEVKCAFGKCLHDGWTARYSDGRTAVAKCMFGDCARDGWTLAIDGQAAPITCRCEFGDCAKNGATCR